jgi:CP family cyanate transporter-like MFS transporter
VSALPAVKTRGRALGERAGPGVVLAIVLLAINWRTVLASLPPLVTDVRADLGLSGAVAGLMTTLPVLCLGALAPLAPRLVSRIPVERALVLCAVVTSAGAGIRGFGTTAALFAGGLLAGVAIALGQALVPILIRGRFPAQSGMLTGAFSMALVLGSAIAAAAAVPLADAFDGSWAASLAFWAIPAAIAALVWLRWGLGPGTLVDPRGGAALRGSGLAWAVAAFFGVQSMAFYASLSWIPTILEDGGWSDEAAGALLALASLVGLLPAFVIPVVSARSRTQLRPLAVVVGLPVAGLVGVLAAPDAALLWMVLIGIGQSGALGLALLLPLQRGGDAATAASLTAMSLCVGYLVAATGPWLLGAVHDLSDDWTAPLVVLIAITAAELIPGIPAALDRTIRRESG